MRDPLTTDERMALAAERPDWVIDQDSMTRTYVFEDFSAAMGFVTRAALAAETLDHHPDIDIRWNKVTLRLSTHSAGTLTGMDRDLAASFDRLAVGGQA